MTGEFQRSLKIGYVMQNDCPEMSEISGPQAHVKAVINGLERRGHRLRVVASQHGRVQVSDDLVTWWPGTGESDGTTAFHVTERLVRGIQRRLHLPFVRFFDSRHFSERCVSALLGYDVLYERYGLLNSGGLMTASRLGIPLILELNGDIVDEYAHLGIRLSRAQWAVIHVVTALTLAKATHVVSASGHQLRERIVHRWHVDPSKVSVITNGADYELFSTPRDPDVIRYKYGLGKSRVVAYVGSFETWHGIDVLIRAFKGVRLQRADTLLVLVGDGPRRSQAAHLVERVGLSGYVVFTGKLKLEGVAEILSVTDVATSPYQNFVETFGLKTPEYMAAGKAIVTSAVNKQHALLQHMRTGILVEPGDETQLAEGILLLLSDGTLRVRMGQDAQAQARSAHTWDHTAAKIEDLCLRLVAENRASRHSPGLVGVRA